MSFTKMSANVNNIQALGDNPNTDDNLTAAQLKAVFDKAASDIKAYLNGALGVNGLVDELDDFAADMETALAGKLDNDSLPEDIGIKIGTATPTYGTGTDQITDGQIYLKYEE